VNLQPAVADVEVIDSPAAAATAVDPLRARILACLAEPGSATTVAASTGETRQKVNYHLRALEAAGLLREVGTRARRGLTERLVVATARSYVLSPAVLGECAADPSAAEPDAEGLSAQYQIAVAARIIRELGELSARAEATSRRLATMTIDTEIRFSDPAARAAFTSELSEAVRALAARYHDEAAEDGRWHRLVVAAHPQAPTTNRDGSPRSGEDDHRQPRPSPED
jgi:DNA-binding transcriptional ArsR family regulator